MGYNREIFIWKRGKLGVEGGKMPNEPKIINDYLGLEWGRFCYPLGVRMDGMIGDYRKGSIG